LAAFLVRRAATGGRHRTWYPQPRSGLPFAPRRRGPAARDVGLLWHDNVPRECASSTLRLASPAGRLAGSGHRGSWLTGSWC